MSCVMKECLVLIVTEQHSLRSFLGFAALIQISTRREDYLVDTIALHDVMANGDSSSSFCQCCNLQDITSEDFPQFHISFQAMSGPQCCENPPVLSPSYGRGHEEEIGGLKCYVIGPPDSKLAVLLVSDVFGYQAPKLRKLGDKVAAFGFYVVVPDFLYGDPYVIENLERPLHVYVKDHGPDKAFEDAKKVLEELKCKGISRIGAAGFCWGAKVVVLLAKYAKVQAAVLLHPSLVSWEDVQAVKVPILVLGAEIDRYSPPELLKKFDEVLNAKPEIASFVKIFPGAKHGWTVRYKDEDEVAVKLANEAHKDMLDWFGRQLKTVGESSSSTLGISRI